MPIILIETRADWITEPAAVIAGVHSAVQNALKVPDWDRTVRLIQTPAGSFPTATRQGGTLYTGRSDDDHWAFDTG